MPRHWLGNGASASSRRHQTGGRGRRPSGEGVALLLSPCAHSPMSARGQSSEKVAEVGLSLMLVHRLHAAGPAVDLAEGLAGVAPLDKRLASVLGGPIGGIKG